MSVRFSLPNGAVAALALFDLNGRRLVTRDVGTLGAGTHTLELGSERPIAPGVYFVRLAQGPRVATARVAILK